MTRAGSGARQRCQSCRHHASGLPRTSRVVPHTPLPCARTCPQVLPPSMQPKKADPSKLTERNADRRPGSTTRRSGGGSGRSSSAAGKAGPGSGFSGAKAGSGTGAGGPGAAKAAPGRGAGKRMSKDEIMRERAKKAVEIKKIKVAKRLRLKGKAPKN